MRAESHYSSSSESGGSPVDTETLCGLVEAIFLHELKNGKVG